jgi:hypothetical protein
MNKFCKTCGKEFETSGSKKNCSEPCQLENKKRLQIDAINRYRKTEKYRISLERYRKTEGYKKHWVKYHNTEKYKEYQKNYYYTVIKPKRKRLREMNHEHN